MERADRAAVSTFHAPAAWGAAVELGETAAHHAAVKRLHEGDAVRLSSGDGRRAFGVVTRLDRRRLCIALDEASIERVPPLPHVELWAPVGDRDRMLLLAEKAVELGVSAWRPIVYRRSRSVVPRGEGDAFRDKVRLRMVGALEQSGSAWLPAQHGEATLDDALRDSSISSGMLLDVSGVPMRTLLPSLRAPIAIAVGPEGGLEPEERERFVGAGWRTASLGTNVLRFETAGIAALALIRSSTP